MNNLIFDWSALGNMALGAVFLYAAKMIWQRWGDKKSRVTPEGCALNQSACRSNMTTEWYAFKLDIKNQIGIQDAKMQSGDDSFSHVNVRLDRTNTLLEAMITIQFKLCHNTPNLDCEDLTRLLIKQGIDVSAFHLNGGP